MIPADQLELITAAVDGELSATEVRAFRQLLDASAEVRALYAKLKADRDRVRALPRATPPADLQAKILARIAGAAPAPKLSPAAPAGPRTQPRPHHERRSTPWWVPVAAAASLLLSVTAVSFAFFNSRSKSEVAAAKSSWSDSLPATQDAPQTVPSPTATAPQTSRPDPDAAVRVDVSPVPPLPQPQPVPPEAIAVAPEPRPARHDLIGARPLPPLPPLDLVKVRVPFLRAVAELDRDDSRQELTDELGRDSAYRFDLFVRDTARGAEVFQNAAKAAGITLFSDALTLERLKKKQIASVVIYTESLTASELSALFAKLCAEDMKFTPRVCDTLHATPVIRPDELELQQIFGTDVGLFKRAAGSSGPGQGGRGDKPVSAGTIDSVTKTLNSPSAKPGEQSAVLMTWQTAHHSIIRTHFSKSEELKQYQKVRGTMPRKPNAVPAVIVIRSLG